MCSYWVSFSSSSSSDAKFASGSSRSCLTSSSTSARTRVTSRTSAGTWAAPRPSPSSQTSSPTLAATRRTSPTSATAATSASWTKRPFWNTFPNTRSPNTSRPTSASTAARATPRRRIWPSTCRSTRIDRTSGQPSPPCPDSPSREAGAVEDTRARGSNSRKDSNSSSSTSWPLQQLRPWQLRIPPTGPRWIPAVTATTEWLRPQTTARALWIQG